MEFNEFLKSKKQTLLTFFVVFLILGVVFTLSQPFKYGAKSKLLVIQEGASGVDPFSVSRSEEYLGTLFSQVVYSSSFFNLVLSSDPNIEKDYFSGDSTQQMKLWAKTISAKSEANTGFIDLTIYHSAPNQAKEIAAAVNQILITQNSNYQGVGSSVKVVVIDEPLVSTYPDQPNLLINFGIVVAGALVFGFIYIYLFPEEKYSLYIFHRRKKNKGNGTLKHNFLEPESQRQTRGAPVEDYAPETEPEGNIRNIIR